jgi:filamentous hemagglutinin
MSGAGAALDADLYNRQLHPDERQWAKDHAKDFAKFYADKTGQTITADQAQQMLLANGYIRVDAFAASGGAGYDSTAAQYLTQNAGGLFTKDQYYNNPFMFGNKDGSATPEQLAMPGGVPHPAAGLAIAGAVTGGLALGPEAVTGIAAAAKACAANPVLCANQAAITAGDVAAGSAMPAGTGASVAGVAGAAGTAAATAEGRASTSTLAALTEAPAVAPTASGYVNATKVCESGCVLAATTPDQQALVSTILRNGDQSGQLTEKLINSIGSSEGYTILSGGKYGGNNGFDHVFVDSSGNVTLLIDSKQINNGTFTLSPTGSGGNMQLSSAWIDSVLSKLDPTSPAYEAIEHARATGTLTTAVAGVDKSTGRVIAVPVKVNSH